MWKLIYSSVTHTTSGPPVDSLGLPCVSPSAHNIATEKVVTIITRNGYTKNIVQGKIWTVEVLNIEKICIWSHRGVRDDNVAIKFSYPTFIC